MNKLIYIPAMVVFTTLFLFELNTPVYPGKVFQQDKTIAPAIAITNIHNKDTVCERPMVEIKTNDKRITVVKIVVHDLLNDVYWVQPKVDRVENTNDWRPSPLPYIGRPGMDGGKSFEIRAIANPSPELHEGDTSRVWPAGLLRSAIVLVIRSK